MYKNLRLPPLIALLLLSCQGTVFAVNIGVSTYVGGSLLGESQASVLTHTDNDPTDQIIATVEGGETGFGGNLFVGAILNDQESFSVAAEFDISLNSNAASPFEKTEVEGGVTSRTVSKNSIRSSLGITARPAWHVTPQADVFVLIGYRYGKIKFSVRDNDPADGPYQLSRNKWRNGIAYGLGTQFTLKKNMKLRLEVGQDNYGTQNYNANGDPIRVKTRLNKAALSLLWFANS